MLRLLHPPLQLRLNAFALRQAQDYGAKAAYPLPRGERISCVDLWLPVAPQLTRFETATHDYLHPQNRHHINFRL